MIPRDRDRNLKDDMLGLENDRDEFVEAVLAQLASAHVQLLQSLRATVNPRQLLYSIPGNKSERN